MENDNVKYEDYLVAYFDILGFKNLIDKNYVSNVKNKYDKAVKAAELARWAVHRKWFSDTFLLYARNDTEVSLDKIVCAVQLFCRKMFMEWIPMHGCLNVGEFYVNEDEDNDIFFGPALNEAYEIAEKQSLIGLVFTKKAENELKLFKIQHTKSRKVFESQYYAYGVPCKSGRILNLPVYDLSYDGIHNTKNKEVVDLWDSLIRMEKRAKKFHDFCNESVIAKYENTKNFLFEVYPFLKKNIEDKNSYFPKHSARNA